MKIKVASGPVHRLDFRFEAPVTQRGKYDKLGGCERKGVL